MLGPRDRLLQTTVDRLIARLKILSNKSQNLSDKSLKSLLREVLRLNGILMYLAQLDGIKLSEPSEPHIVSDPNTLEAQQYAQQYWERRDQLKKGSKDG